MKKIVNGVESNMTQMEQDVFNQNKPSIDLALEVRMERDRLLAETDYLALSDNTMSAAMTTYRQALRDITDQAGFPTSVTWPTKP